MFDVKLDPSGLINHPVGPFYIDFQLNDGSGNFAGVNSATINNFTFGGGSPNGTPNLFGGTTGNLSSAITLTDNAPFINEFFQQFTPASFLSFTMSITT